MRVKSLGFSLIEILFVLALLGLVSSVCVLHFDTIQSAFSGGKVHPNVVLEEAIQQGRLTANQLHERVYICLEEERFLLKRSNGDTIQTFDFPKQDLSFQCKFLPGMLTQEGFFKPSENACPKLLINEEGFIPSTFIDISYGEDHEKYEVDTFTGALKSAQW